jgi:hypothetical protein
MDDKLKRKGNTQWVDLEKLRVRTDVTQRRFNAAWANEIAKNFDIDRFRRPVVNRVGEWFWVVDGQHSIAAYKQWLGDWHGQKVECEVLHDLSEKDEADLFDWLNFRKSVGAYDTFVIRLTAQRPEETNIDAIVRLHKLKIARQRSEGVITCVSALRKVYRSIGEDGLAHALEIAHGAFGTSGLDADMLSAIGLMVGRFNGLLQPKPTAAKLSAVRGGANAVRTRAERMRQQTGQAKSQCIAAACVESINRVKGGRKLPKWWKAQAPE